MFEFQGWVTICVPYNGDEDISVFDRHEENTVSSLQKVLDELDKDLSGFWIFEIRRIGNGLNICNVDGRRNHRYEAIIKSFEWIAHNLPESYGLLCTHDDEHFEYNNKFRVWQAALGNIVELGCSYLSLVIPTVVKPWITPSN